MNSSLLLALGIGYLLGSIPFGLLLAMAGGKGDIRDIGSGNIGATNVLRTGRKGLAAATLLLDGAKGAAAVFLAQFIDPAFGVLGAAGAFFGHCYPVWLGFRGGKGVATYAGIAFALLWQVGLVFAAVWIGVLAVTRYSSLGGLLAAIAPATPWPISGSPLAYLTGFVMFAVAGFVLGAFYGIASQFWRKRLR